MANAIKRIDLALQGGGAHGAFTWGVLDRLLEDERLEIAAVSGASAGAMNGVVLAHGLMAGGRVQAREALRRFWSRVSNAARAGSTLQGLFRDWSLDGTMFGYADWISHVYSPYQFNPFNINPLRDIVASEVDFDLVRGCNKMELFISCTHVRTGRLREFRKRELNLDVVMASACLPTLFRAVEIEGEAYWDGGYVGNPSLMPLITESPAQDLMLVQINPSLRDEVPTRAQAIVDRVNEITFNNSLLKELRTIALLKQLLQIEGLPTGTSPGSLFSQVHALKLHRIDAEEKLARFGASSKMITAWPFVLKLHQIGREAAALWLDRNFTHIGRHSTLEWKAYL